MPDGDNFRTKETYVMTLHDFLGSISEFSHTQILVPEGYNSFVFGNGQSGPVSPNCQFFYTSQEELIQRCIAVTSPRHPIMYLVNSRKYQKHAATWRCFVACTMINDVLKLWSSSWVLECSSVIFVSSCFEWIALIAAMPTLRTGKERLRKKHPHMIQMFLTHYLDTTIVA